MLITEQFYTLTIITLKLSLGLFFLRITAFTWQRWVIYCVMVVSSLIGTTYFFIGVFQCGYFSSIWVFLERRITLQGCIPEPAALGAAYTQASVSALTDWICAILPLFMLRNTRIRKREKYVVFGIISLAATYDAICFLKASGTNCSSSGSIASLVRFQYIPVLMESTSVFFSHSVGIANWSCVEIGFGIIAGCLATLRPLLRKVFHLGPVTQSNTHISTTVLNPRGSGIKLTDSPGV
jgi:hypothetical protein